MATTSEAKGSNDVIRPLVFVVGFNGNTLLSGAGVGVPAPVPGGSQVMLTTAKSEFARQLLMWFAQGPSDLKLTMSLLGDTAVSKGAKHTTIGVTGSGGFNATLVIDQPTCLPAALTFERPATVADIRMEEAAKGLDDSSSSSGARVFPAAPTGTRLVRIDLTEYRRYGRLMLAGIRRTTIGGLPYNEERILDVEFDPDFEPGHFDARP
jgi:hypothetical protein